MRILATLGVRSLYFCRLVHQRCRPLNYQAPRPAARGACSTSDAPHHRRSSQQVQAKSTAPSAVREQPVPVFVALDQVVFSTAVGGVEQRSSPLWSCRAYFVPCAASWSIPSCLRRHCLAAEPFGFRFSFSVSHVLHRHHHEPLPDRFASWLLCPFLSCIFSSSPRLLPDGCPFPSLSRRLFPITSEPWSDTRVPEPQISAVPPFSAAKQQSRSSRASVSTSPSIFVSVLPVDLNLSLRCFALSTFFRLFSPLFASVQVTHDT